MSTYYRPTRYAAAELDAVPPDTPLPVVVVGAGPVGLAAALGLVRRGIPVTVIEAADSVSVGSRAICLSRHSLEVADRIGIGAALEEVALAWEGGRSFYREHEVLHFRMRHEEYDVRGPMVNISQSEVEQIMVDALLAEPLATIHWSTELTGYSQNDDRVELDVRTAAGVRHLRARWVVAADGARSAMRAATGVSLAGTSYEGRYVIADIHWPSGLPVERLAWFDPPSNPGSTILMHQQPRDIWRIDYQLDPSEDTAVESRADRIEERITRHLAWLKNDVPWTMEWSGFYRAHSLALEQFVHGRVLFAGDAAHLVPIFGVRGLNSGLEDAETLAWQLAAVLHGTADASLLRAYSAERRDAWQQNIDNAGKSTLIMTPGTDGYRATRDAILALATEQPQLRHLINPRQSSATHARRSPLTWSPAQTVRGVLPGDPLEDRKVRVRRGAGWVDSSLNTACGHGFAVLGVGDVTGPHLAEPVRRLAAALAPEQVRAVLVSRSGTSHVDAVVIDDTAGSFTAALGASEGEYFVVRPDGLVLCRVSDPRLLMQVGDRLSRANAPTDQGGHDHADASQPPDETHREGVWIGLSEALNKVAESDREGFLTRLAIALGTDSALPFSDAIALAMRTGSHTSDAS